MVYLAVEEKKLAEKRSAEKKLADEKKKKKNKSNGKRKANDAAKVLTSLIEVAKKKTEDAERTE